MERSDGRAWTARICAATVLVNAAVIVAIGYHRCYRTELNWLATSIADDSYYYLLPAFNFKSSYRFTFDGLHLTYGFQPLWELVLAALGFMVTDKTSFLRAAVFTQYLCRAAASVVLYALCTYLIRRDEDDPQYLVGLAASQLLILNLPILYVMAGGKENAIYSLLLVLTLAAAIASVRRPTPGQYALLAAGLASLILVRLSPTCLLVVGATLAYGRPRSRRALSALLLGFLLPLVAWYGYALAAFGSLLPVSGKVKLQGFESAVQSGSIRDDLPDILRAAVRYAAECWKLALGHESMFLGSYALMRTYSLTLPLLALLAASLLARRRSYRGLGPGKYIAGLAAATLLGELATAVLLYHRREELYYYSWYVTEGPIVLAVVAALALRVPKHRTALVGVAAALAVVFLIDGQRLLRAESRHRRFVHDDRQWQHVILRATEVANARFGATSDVTLGALNAGLLGYFSQQRVINFDGMANNDVYVFYRAGGSRIEYAWRERVEYFIDPITDEGLFGNHFAYYEIEEALPFEHPSPAVRGYGLAKVTRDPFPSSTVVVRGERARADFVPWVFTPVLGGLRSRLIVLAPGTAGPTDVTFHLEREYAEFRAVAGACPEQNGALSGDVQPLSLGGRADGRRLFDLKVDGSAPRTIAAPVTGIKEFRLTVEGAATAAGRACLGDVRFLTRSKRSN